MKTMKLIELFVKIAKGENTPEKIKFKGFLYTHNGTSRNSYYYCEETDKLLEDSFIFEELNYNVYIIEDTPKEDKKITRIERKAKNIDNHYLKDKINEIIDKINGE